MSRLIVRKLGLLAAAVLLAATTPAFAAPPADDPSIHVTKKKTSTLAGLSPELQTSAIEKARAKSKATKLTTPGAKPQGGHSDLELSLMCNGDWFITWDEDANGNPISHTFKLHCNGEAIPIG